LDFETIAFALTAFVGGLIAIPVGGSFLFIIPVFLLLGLNGLETLILGRILMTATMGTSSLYFFTKHKFDWKQILYFLSGNILGFYLSAKLIANIDINKLTVIVPMVLLIGAIALTKNFKLKNKKWQKIFYQFMPLIGLLLGFYAGLGGGGNGKIIVLLLTLVFGWTIHRAIINTRLIEFVGNIIAVGFYLLVADAELTGFEIPVILAGAAGGLLGAKITLKSKPNWLKNAFLILVFISLIKTLWGLFSN
jgi:uncharacterized protein